MTGQDLTRRTLFGVAAAGAAATLAGCGSGGGDAAGGTGGAGGAQPGGGTIDPEKPLRYATTFMQTIYDPHMTRAASDNIGLVHVYDRLVHRDEKNKLIPGLATKWEISQDLKTFTLTLREGLKFADGTPFDAAAVKANLDRARGAGASGSVLLKPITSVEAQGTNTVVCQLNGPPAALPGALTELPGMMVNPKAFATPDKVKELATKPDGIGRYRLVNSKPGASYEYEATPDYWDQGAAPAKKFIVELSGDPETRMNSLQGGQVDVAQVAPSIVKRAKDAGMQILTATNANVTIVQLNRTRPFFKNKLVRQAMSFALDRKAIADAVLEGLGQPAFQLPLKDDPAFSQQADEFFKFDVEKAKELMAQSGQGPFEFGALTLNFPEQKAVAEIVKQQLAAIGITMNILPRQAADISVQWATGAGDATCSLVTTRADYSALWRSMFAPDSPSNPSREAPAGFIEKIDAADREIDPTARGKLLGEVSYALTEDVAALMITRDIRGVVASNKLVGYKPTSYAPDEFRGVGVAQ